MTRSRVKAIYNLVFMVGVGSLWYFHSGQMAAACGFSFYVGAVFSSLGESLRDHH